MGLQWVIYNATVVVAHIHKGSLVYDLTGNCVLSIEYTFPHFQFFSMNALKHFVSSTVRMTMEQFLADSRACRLDSQAAGPETRYYTAFANFFQRILPNSVVLEKDSSIQAVLISDFTIMAKNWKSERLYCSLKPNPTARICVLSCNDSSMAINSGDICRKSVQTIILTNYWEYIWLNFADDEITIVGGDENIYRVAPTEAELGP